MGVSKTWRGTSGVQLVLNVGAFPVTVFLSHSPGSDIIMQLDDVVSSTMTGPRVEEAMYRYVCVCVRACVRACVCVSGGGEGENPGPAALSPYPSPSPYGLQPGSSFRSIRWLDRCIAAHQRPDKQNLFAIIQGGLDADLRATCLKGKAMCQQDQGFSIAESPTWAWHAMVLRELGFFVFVFVFGCTAACRILVPQPGTEPRPSAVSVES